MKQFVFVLKNAWHGIFSKKLLSGIVIAAMAVGLIFPAIILSQINFYYQNYGVPYYNDMEHTAVAEFYGPLMDESGMKLRMASWGSNVKNAGFFATYSTTFEYNGSSYLSNVSGYSKEYMEIGKTVLVDGRFLTQEEFDSGAKVCLSMESRRVDGKPIKVGDTITIAGTDFKIVGIIRDNKSYGSAFISYHALYDWLKDANVQYKAYLQTQGEPDMDGINHSLLTSKDIEKIDLHTAAEAQEDLLSKVGDMYKQKLLLGAVMLLFSMISFALIIAGKTLNEQYVLGVKTAMGATKGQLFWDLALQNFILIEIASILAMLFSSILSQLIPGLDGLFGGPVVIAIEALCVVITFFITAAAFIPVCKGSVCDLLKNSND